MTAINEYTETGQIAHVADTMTGYYYSLDGQSLEDVLDEVERNYDFALDEDDDPAKISANLTATEYHDGIVMDIKYRTIWADGRSH